MKRGEANRGWLIFTAVAAVLTCAILAGSFFLLKDAREKREKPLPAQITAHIVEQTEYRDLIEVSAGQVAKHYDVEQGVVQECSLYISSSSENAAELGCFLLVSEKDYPKLQTAVVNHMNAKASAYQALNPAQYEATKKYVLQQKGRYVLVAVGGDTASAVQIFNRMLK